MKRARVLISTAVLLAVVAVVCFVPLPISRVRGLGLVQPHPEAEPQQDRRQRHRVVGRRLGEREAGEEDKGREQRLRQALDGREERDAARDSIRQPGGSGDSGRWNGSSPMSRTGSRRHSRRLP